MFETQIELGAEVTSDGIRALAGLPDLQASSFECSDASPEALEAVSTLTGLTCIEVSPFSLTLSYAFDLYRS